MPAERWLEVHAVAPSQVDLGPEPAQLLRQFNRPPHETARELIASEPYREGLISRGRAAVPLADFLRLADRAGLPYLDVSAEDR